MRLRPSVSLDATDLRILEILKKNARISNVSLAEAVGISPAPCLRRVRELERKGVIAGYGVQVNRSMLGLGVMALSEVQLKSTAAAAMEDFEKAATRIPEVARCYVTSGDWDYMLEIYSEDLTAFEQLANRHLAQLPGVKRVRSRFALRESRTSVL